MSRAKYPRKGVLSYAFLPLILPGFLGFLLSRLSPVKRESRKPIHRRSCCRSRRCACHSTRIGRPPLPSPSLPTPFSGVGQLSGIQPQSLALLFGEPAASEAAPLEQVTFSRAGLLARIEKSRCDVLMFPSNADVLA